MVNNKVRGKIQISLKETNVLRNLELVSQLVLFPSK